MVGGKKSRRTRLAPQAVSVRTGLADSPAMLRDFPGAGRK